MENREIRVRELHQSGLSYRKIAKSLNMSLRDVTKALANPIAGKAESGTMSVPVQYRTRLDGSLTICARANV